MNIIQRITGGGEGGHGFVPGRAVPFPVTGHTPPSSATEFGGTDLSPELVRARYTESLLPGRITLVNDNTLNPGTNHPIGGPGNFPVVGTWLPVGPIDRPMLLVPIDVPSGSSTDATGDVLVPAQNGGRILYWPGKKPPAPVPFSDAFVSDNFGICYLSHPGLWWLYLDNLVASTVTKLSCELIDASDPGVVSRILAEPGCQIAMSPVAASAANQGIYTRTALTVDRSLCPANRYRTALVIQNTGAYYASQGGAVVGGVNNSVRLGLGCTAGNPSLNSGGILLAPGASLTLSGPTCWRGAIRVIVDGASNQAVPTGAGNLVLVDVTTQEFQ